MGGILAGFGAPAHPTAAIAVATGLAVRSPNVIRCCRVAASMTKNRNPAALSAAVPAAPRPVFDLKDAVALVVGIVVGAGIFKLPALVAANTGDAGTTIRAWS